MVVTVNEMKSYSPDELIDMIKHYQEKLEVDDLTGDEVFAEVCAEEKVPEHYQDKFKELLASTQVALDQSKKTYRPWLRAVTNKLTVERIVETETRGGIVLPTNVATKKYYRGKVLTLGKGDWDGGKFLPWEYQAGDGILYDPRGVVAIDEPGLVCDVVHFASVLGVVHMKEVEVK